MAASPVGRQQWEYRHVFAVPRFRGYRPGGVSGGIEQLTEDLLTVVEDLHESGGEGWQVVRVKLEEDGYRRCWLSACLKRPLAKSDQQPDLPASSAPRHEARSCTISDLLGTAPTMSDVNRAA